MTHRNSRPRAGRRRLATIAGASGILLGLGAFALVGPSAAAYQDQATVGLGGAGIGNPNRFDIAIADADGAAQDAATPAEAVVLPTDGAAAFSEDAPVGFTAQVVNRDPGLAGDLTLTLTDPDPVEDDLWSSLRFTVVLDGAAEPAVAGATADEVNAAGLRFDAVAPGQTHTVHIDAVLAPDTAEAAAGKTTSIGLQVDGESR